jgi:hypothetical protein
VRLSSVAEGGLLGSDIRGLLGCWRSDSRRAALAFGWTCQPRRCAPRTLPATRPVPWRACFPAVRDRRAAQRPDPARPGPVTRSVPGSEAPPVARMATGLVGEEPVPSRVWTPAFAQKSRSVNRAGRVGSHGFTHTQPNRFASRLPTLQTCEMSQQNGTKSRLRLVPSYQYPPPYAGKRAPSAPQSPARLLHLIRRHYTSNGTSKESNKVSDHELWVSSIIY